MKANSSSAKHERPGAHTRRHLRTTPICGMPKIQMRSDVLPEEDRIPCHVYLLVHSQEARFKIGISVAPTIRLTALPEAYQIDHEQSLTLCLPSQNRALRIEKILHKALDDFRLLVHSSLGVSWPGGTEWFHLEGFMHAVDLLQRLPKGRTQQTLRLQRLDGGEVDENLYLWKISGDERRLRREAAARENVIQMRRIRTLFKAIEPYRDWSWRPATQAGTDALGRVAPAQPERVVIKGLASLWEPGTIGPRYALGFSETWMFQTGKGRKEHSHRTMVSLIRFSAEQPIDLELHLIDRQSMRTWPGAALMLRIWEELVGG
jgi:hypothetical protein